MVAACPTCKTKFRIPRERLSADGVRLRCTRCAAVFRVKAPEEEALVEPTVDAQPTPAPRRLEPERLVLVAHADPDLCKRLADTLEAWGLHALAAYDGVEAILAVQRHGPRAVVLDAALPKMYGFQVCELIKRNESLRSIPVVLVAAIHDKNRYRRPPGELYGADVYLEPQDLPDALREPLARFGLPLRGAPAARAAAPARASAPPRQAAPAAAERPRQRPAPAAGDEELAKAERLARIIVSDVILYNEQKFAAAVAAGNVMESLEPDLQEGRALFQARIDPALARQRDFLREELLRVARQRGMR
jgi:predicted Zn finger-like uncharacterized protein